MSKIKVEGLQLPGSEDVYIFSPALATDVTNNPGAPVQAGAAADAKAVADALDQKANQSDVNSALAEKADQSSVDSALAGKADQSEVTNKFNTVNQNLNGKISKTSIVTNLESSSLSNETVPSSQAVKNSLNKKIEVSTIQTYIPSGSWTQEGQLYKKEVFCSGMSESEIPTIVLDWSQTSRINAWVDYDLLLENWNKILYSKSVYGQIIFYARENLNYLNDLPIQITRYK